MKDNSTTLSAALHGMASEIDGQQVINHNFAQYACQGWLCKIRPAHKFEVSRDRYKEFISAIYNCYELNLN